jgi:hypothetical protein
MNAARLTEDMERYRTKALELGATKSAIVRVREIPVDERIVLKCQIPRCFGYGACAHCPPNTLKPAELREILKGYQSAVFFIMDVPPDVIVRDRATMATTLPSVLPPALAVTHSAANMNAVRRWRASDAESPSVPDLQWKP